MQGIILSKNTLVSNLGSENHSFLISALNELHVRGIKLITISKDKKPPDFNKYFPNIIFIQKPHRQSSGVARQTLVDNGCEIDRSLVLATSDEDIIMASNSKIFSLTAAWSDRLGEKTKYAMGIQNPNSLPKILEYLNGSNPWFSIADYENDFSIYSLINAGDYNSLPELAGLTQRIKENLKEGTNSYHNVFRFILVSSILKTTDLLDVNYWGFYPSSKSKPWTDEIIYKYYEYAKFASCNTGKKEPLFIRTKNAPKRSLGEVANRLDPNNQLDTLVLNPYYKGKLRDKKVAVIDDFTTNGTSFWVAYSLLKRAGAKSVRGIAMGKFGCKLQKYQIDLSSRNPFAHPLIRADYLSGKNDTSIYYKNSLSELKDKMKEFL